MIRINYTYLDNVAKRHYEEYFINRDFKSKLNDHISTLSNSKEKSFFEFLENNIEEIIMGKPYVLGGLVKIVENEHKSINKKIISLSDFEKSNKKAIENLDMAKKKLKKLENNNPNPKEITDLKLQVNNLKVLVKKNSKLVKEAADLVNTLKSIFNYDHFIKQYVKKNAVKITWGAYELVKTIGITVCPYCNRQFTSTLEPESDGKTGRTRPHLDHFYSKSKYPFLAVSFYNLIPSCSVCNSNLKRDIDFSMDTHLNPYDCGFDDLLNFTIKFNKRKRREEEVSNYISAWFDNPDVFKVGFKVNQEMRKKMDHKELLQFLKKALNNKEVFKLEELYNTHKDYIGEIIVKAQGYNYENLKSLANQFPGLFPEQKDVTRLLFGNYTLYADLDKRPLAKLTRDITREFGVW